MHGGVGTGKTFMMDLFFEVIFQISAAVLHFRGSSVTDCAQMRHYHHHHHHHHHLQQQQQRRRRLWFSVDTELLCVTVTAGAFTGIRPYCDTASQFFDVIVVGNGVGVCRCLSVSSRLVLVLPSPSSSSRLIIVGRPDNLTYIST